MSKFILANKRNGACVICGNETGKCRRTPDLALHLCMTHGDARLGEVINGYKCVKIATAQNWASFKEDNSREWSDSQRETWRQLLETQKRTRTLVEEQRSQKSLTPVERDRLYRAMLDELSLHPDDKRDLINRGFTLEQIEQSGFKSVEQWQKLNRSYNPQLPGVSDSGRSLLTAAGYLIPLQNAEGLIVACQVRLRATETEGRYRWLTSHTKKHSHGQTPHLYPQGCQSGGELPLALHRPTGVTPLGIALAEGTGAKPFLASQRLKQLVIGAAGGQWASSPIAFKHTLSQLSKELGGIREITLYPDAGDVKNTSVMRRWQQTVALLKKWQWTVKVAWWEQVSKDQPDIDELNNFTKIRYLTPTEFFEWGTTRTSPPPDYEKLHIGEAWDNWRQARLFSPDLTLNSDYFHTDLPSSKTLLAIRSGLGTGKTFWLVNFLLKQLPDYGYLSIGYRNSLLLQFCASTQGWYHLQQDLKGGEEILLLKDPQSKIACCIDSLIYFNPSDFNGKIVILDEIESIIKQLLQANTAVSYHREKIKELFVELLNRADRIICLDGHLTDGTIEYLQSLQINPKNLIKIQNFYTGNRGEVEFFEGAVHEKGISLNDYSPVFEAIWSHRNRIAIGSDAQEKIEALDNLFKEQGKKTLRYDSTKAKEKWVEAFLRNPAAYLSENQIEVFLYSPSAEAGLNIDIKGYFTDIYFLFLGVLTTNPQMQMMGRIRDPDAKIHVYCQYQGLPSEAVSKNPIPEKLLQEIKAYVLDCASASFKGIDKQDIIFNLAQKLVEFSTDSHWEQEVKLIALENHERAHLRNCLREALMHSGYKVNCVTGQKFEGRQLKEKNSEVRDEKAAAIHAAKDISTEQANEKARNFGATLGDKYEVMKRRLLERLPGIERAFYTVTVPIESNLKANSNKGALETMGLTAEVLEARESGVSLAEQVQLSSVLTKNDLDEKGIEYQTLEKPIFSPKFVRLVKFDDRSLISKIELYWLLLHPEEAKRLQLLRWHKQLCLFTDPQEPDCVKKMNLSTYRSRWLKISRLIEMGVKHFFRPGVTWSGNSPEVLEFWQKGKQQKFSRAVGVKVGKSTPCDYLGKVLRSLAVQTEFTYNRILKTRVYQLDLAAMTAPYRNAIYEAVGRRYHSYLDSSKVRDYFEELNWEKPVNQCPQGVEGRSPFEKCNNKTSEGDRSLPDNFSDSREGQSSKELRQNQLFFEGALIKLDWVGKVLEVCRGVHSGKRLRVVRQIDRWLYWGSQFWECCTCGEIQAGYYRLVEDD